MLSECLSLNTTLGQELFSLCRANSYALLPESLQFSACTKSGPRLSFSYHFSNSHVRHSFWMKIPLSSSLINQFSAVTTIFQQPPQPISHTQSYSCWPIIFRPRTGIGFFQRRPCGLRVKILDNRYGDDIRPVEVGVHDGLFIVLLPLTSRSSCELFLADYRSRYSDKDLEQASHSGVDFCRSGDNKGKGGSRSSTPTSELEHGLETRCENIIENVK